jgi:hypothetical protein
MRADPGGRRNAAAADAAGRGGRARAAHAAAAQARPPPADEPDASGISVAIRNLATGAEMTFGNVGETAWRDSGSLLAMTISAADRAGNGIHLYDAGTGALRVLDSSNAQYIGLAWRRDAPDLLVMRGKVNEKKDGSTYLILAWTGVGTTAEKHLTYDPTADASFPAGMRVVTFRRAAWTDDGASVLLGIAAWSEKPAPPPGAGRAGRGNGGGEGPIHHRAATRTPDEARAVEAPRVSRRPPSRKWPTSRCGTGRTRASHRSRN